MNKPLLLIPCALAAALILAGCQSSIRPLRPIQHQEVWVPDELPSEASATAPATEPATQMAEATTQPATAPAPPATMAEATTQPAATQPGHMVVKVIDPNQTSRFIYKARYDNVWQQAMTLLNATGFTLDRQDYRLGVITTQPLPSSQFIEFWKPQQTSPNAAMENTVNNQRRSVRLTISKVPGKPDFYEIAIQVLVERKTNPSELIGGPLFVEGSGFGRNAVTLRSDFAEPTVGPGRWITIGHDPELEHKLLNELFLRI